MNWNPQRTARRIRSMPSRLHDLAANLAHLSQDTRARIAETVAETIAQIARDGLHRFWCGSEPHHPRHAESYPPTDAWGDPIDSESWDCPDPREFEREIAAATHAQPPGEGLSLPPAQVLALSLKAAAWYLLRRGSLAYSLGLGALVGGAAMIGGKAVLTGFDLLQTAGELASLNDRQVRASANRNEV